MPQQPIVTLSHLLLVLGALCLYLCSPQAIAINPKEIHQQIISQTPIYHDVEANDYVRRVGEEIVKANGLEDGNYQFFLLDSPSVNASTIGSGYVYMHRGLLTLLTSEGQLAGVLAHEIGHNEGRHISRRKSKQAWSSISSLAAWVITGSSSVSGAVGVANQASISSFGREMELEADEYAARFMYQAKYDPEEMLGVLSILKDHERFNNSRSKDGGSYHGVFSSHPRSDKRLREVVQKAGSLPPGEAYRGREPIREVLTGMVFGPNYNGNPVPGMERYASKKLAITFVYPDGWKRTLRKKAIVLKNTENSLQLKLSIERHKDRSVGSKDMLKTKFPEDLKKVKVVNKSERKSIDLGTMGRVGEKRVAIINIGRSSYFFEGISRDNKLTKEEDAQLIEIIKSLRKADKVDYRDNKVAQIYYERLQPGDTFSDLANRVNLGPLTELHLRLMNGYYPKGEPEPGTWMKLVKLAKPGIEDSRE